METSLMPVSSAYGRRDLTNMSSSQHYPHQMSPTEKKESSPYYPTHYAPASENILSADLSQLDDGEMYGCFQDISTNQSSQDGSQLDESSIAENGAKLEKTEEPPKSIQLDEKIPSSIRLDAVTQYVKLNNDGGSKVASVTSLDSRSSFLARSSSSPAKPKLYSAIGSLEKCSVNSFGKIQSQQHSDIVAGRFPRVAPALVTEAPMALTRSLIDPKNAMAAVKQSDSFRQPLMRPIEKVTKAQSERPPSSSSGENDNPKELKKVTISTEIKPRKDRERKSKAEMFRPSSDAYTPRMDKKKAIKYKPAAQRAPVKDSSNMGTLSRPNFKDALRRVAMIIQQHIIKIERRMQDSREGGTRDGLFRTSMMEAFSEDKFATPRYKCSMVRLPMARPGMIYGMRKLQERFKIPTEEEIYEFGHQLFRTVQLSSECSIVCLIYVERLMEVAKVPLVCRTWKPIFMCGLLLASKVWQDLSSWNIEFASVYPQFTLDAINSLELQFLRMAKWDLYISSSLYAKYYFALRSLLEKSDFRQRYNRMVGGVRASDALKVQKRSEQVKEEALALLSRSM